MQQMGLVQFVHAIEWTGVGWLSFKMLRLVWGGFGLDPRPFPGWST